ncbi:WD domain, G-beta repeat [Thalassoglobus neptunius]|uniref:WD domain, G-beta repeat n=1 Tax=Thalassoglobus neptunius TaxID=1938619 RepID=A0A5C5VQ30_9PLAN|nr:c-type cytochrome domain-containing protein [Thalassoglobus neptunius]TWT40716.1 WD domain, G-beta repeat [Thalassoglobus neptunius]
MRAMLIVWLFLTPAFSIIAEEGITPVEPDLNREVDFYRDIYPILESKCLACHSSAVAENDLILENAEAILKGGLSGEAVIAGDPDESYLYRVAARVDEPVMPPLPNKAQAKALTPQELGLLRKWIEEGARAGERYVETTLAWQPIPESFKAVYSLALDPTRQFIFAGRGNRIFVYDILTGQQFSRLSDPALQSIQSVDGPLYGPGVAHRDFVHSLAINADGSRLASGGFRVVKIWDREAPQELWNQRSEQGVSQVANDINGSRAAFLLTDGTISIWDLANNTLIGTVPQQGERLTSIAFGKETQTLIGGGESGTITFIDLSDLTVTPGLKTESVILKVGYSPATQQVITAHADHTIRVWKPETASQAIPEGEPIPEPVHTLSGHTSAVQHLELDSAGKTLLTGIDEGKVRLWDLETGQQIFFRSVDVPLTNIALSPNGQLIAASGTNGVTRAWNRKGDKLADISGNQELSSALKRTTDDQAVAKAQLDLAEKALADTQKDLADREQSLKKAQEEKEKADKDLAEKQTALDAAQKAADEANTKLAEKPDDEALKKQVEETGKALKTAQDNRQASKDAVDSAARAVELSEQSVQLGKDQVAGRQQQKEQAASKLQQADTSLSEAQAAVTAFQSSPQSIVFDQDGNRLISSGPNQPTQVWNASTGQGLGLIPIPSNDLVSSQWTASGSFLTVSSDGSVRSWDITPRWKLSRVLGVDGDSPLNVSQSAFQDRVMALAFHPDGETLATGGGEPSRSGELQFWNTSTGEKIRTIEDAHSDTVTDLEFSRTGEKIVSGATDKFVKVFRVEDGSLVRSYEGHTDHVLGVAFKADESRLASSGADLAIKIWNAETGEQVRTISNYAKQVTSIQFVGITDNLISCSGDQNAKFHTAENGRNFRTFGGSQDYLYSVLSTDDESLVIAAGEDGIVRVWNGKDGALLQSFSPPAPSSETVQK